MSFPTGSQARLTDILYNFLVNSPNFTGSSTTFISTTLSFDRGLTFFQDTIANPRPENNPQQMILISRSGGGKEQRVINGGFARILSNVKFDIFAKSADYPASGSASSRLEDAIGKLEDALFRLGSGSYTAGNVVWAQKNSEQFLKLPMPNIGGATQVYQVLSYKFYA